MLFQNFLISLIELHFIVPGLDVRLILIADEAYWH